MTITLTWRTTSLLLVLYVPIAFAQARPTGGEHSGNPVIHGWYADPEAIVYGKQYWIFPTYSDDYGASKTPLDEKALTPRQKQAINKQYLKQTFFDAFSSPDLVHWQKHSRVLDIKDVKWAAFAL